MGSLIPLGEAPLKLEPPPQKRAREIKSEEESEDEEDDINTENVLEKTSAELDKELDQAEFIEGANEVNEYFYLYILYRGLI